MILGLFRTLSLCLSAFLLLGLLAGTVVLGDTTAAGQNLVFIAMTATLLALEDDRLRVGPILRGRLSVRSR